MDATVRLSIDVKSRGQRPTFVMLVSGDADRLSMMRRVLEQEGYGVLEARHPGHALVTAMRHRGPLDLLLADEGDGSGRPEFPVSLFRERPAMKLLRLEAGPHTREELLDSVRAALHAVPC